MAEKIISPGVFTNEVDQSLIGAAKSLIQPKMKLLRTGKIEVIFTELQKKLLKQLVCGRMLVFNLYIYSCLI